MQAEGRTDEQETPAGASQPEGHRSFVGYASFYDAVGAVQFSLLAFLGLREHHSLLDIGCGSLRAGKLFIPYLLPGNYHGLEPEEWLVQQGITSELTEELVERKQARFLYRDDYRLTAFDRTFDFMLAHSIFTHAPEHQIRACLAETREVMTETSMFVATFWHGSDNYTGEEWVYPGSVTYTPEHTAELAREHGLTMHTIDWPHPTGHDWVVFVRQENTTPIAQVNDTMQLSRLRDEAAFWSTVAEGYRVNPYTRFALKLSALMKRLGFGRKRG